MCRGDLDGLQRLRIKPIVCMTNTADTEQFGVSVDDGEFDLAIERSGFDAAPSRSVEEAGEGCC